MRLSGYLYRKWFVYFWAKSFSRINNQTISSQLLLLLTPPMQMEHTECSKTSAHKMQTPGKHTKVRIQHLLSLLKFPIYLQCLLNFLFVPYHFIPVLSKNSIVIRFCNTACQTYVCCVGLEDGFIIKLHWRLQKPHFLDFLWYHFWHCECISQWFVLQTDTWVK